MLLQPNMTWTLNQKATQPSVYVDIEVTGDYLNISFSVEEDEDCFRAEVKEDNGRSWEDSCVEIFLNDPTGKTQDYYNFELTSRGCLLAARGPDRGHRELLEKSDLDKVVRYTKPAAVAGNLICWELVVRIPALLFGLKSYVGATLKGNLYKCADKAKSPHYQSLFPIETEKPDFHRPEFFGEF
ncbi:MAG: hypothetical protein HUK20_01395 [Fibrobacter sp.]|nr:hypothetical protein [Fibrobacter sp.]